MESKDILTAKFIETNNQLFKVEKCRQYFDTITKELLLLRLDVKAPDVKLGNFIFEWQSEASGEMCFFTPYSIFPMSEATSWPPPRNITVNDVEYVSMNTNSGIHNPYLAQTTPYSDYINNCATNISIIANNDLWQSVSKPTTKIIQHWEYQDSTVPCFLQVFADEDSIVTMCTGIVISEVFIILL